MRLPATRTVVYLLILLAAFCAVFLIVMQRPAKAESCIASHYGIGDGYGGKRTASGERMNPRAMTAAMLPPQPLGSYVRVTNLVNRKSVVVRVNDRGPHVKGRCVDLSFAAFRMIAPGGLARVSVSR